MKIGRLSSGHISAAIWRKVAISLDRDGILGVWASELAHSRYIWVILSRLFSSFSQLQLKYVCRGTGTGFHTGGFQRNVMCMNVLIFSPHQYSLTVCLGSWVLSLLREPEHQVTRRDKSFFRLVTNNFVEMSSLPLVFTSSSASSGKETFLII